VEVVVLYGDWRWIWWWMKLEKMVKEVNFEGRDDEI